MKTEPIYIILDENKITIAPKNRPSKTFSVLGIFASQEPLFFELLENIIKMFAEIYEYDLDSEPNPFSLFPKLSHDEITYIYNEKEAEYAISLPISILYHALEKSNNRGMLYFSLVDVTNIEKESDSTFAEIALSEAILSPLFEKFKKKEWDIAPMIIFLPNKRSKHNPLLRKNPKKVRFANVPIDFNIEFYYRSYNPKNEPTQGIISVIMNGLNLITAAFLNVYHFKATGNRKYLFNMIYHNGLNELIKKRSYYFFPNTEEIKDYANNFNKKVNDHMLFLDAFEGLFK